MSQVFVRMRPLLVSFSLLCFFPCSKAWVLQPRHHPHTPSLIMSTLTRRHSLLSSSSTSTMDTAKDEDKIVVSPQTDDVVTISCRLQPQGDFVPEPLIDGVVSHDASCDTDIVVDADDCNAAGEVELQFVLNRGNYLPGLHDLITHNMTYIGQRLENIPMDAGWGDVNANLIATVSYEASGLKKEQIQVGTKLRLSNGLDCVVTAVTENDFTMDGNPPLAGAYYLANVTLLNVQPGPLITGYRKDEEQDDSSSSSASTTKSPFEVATFAMGCFWGGELDFMRVPGVVGTAVGYAQGQTENPTYQQVCSGTTGHTEAIQVIYNPDVVTYDALVHLAMDRLGQDKYLKNQVGNDIGTQYRHGVYYHNPQQEKIAKAIVESFGDNCQTECLPADDNFWRAEDYHQQYLLKGGQSARKGDSSTIRCYG